MTELTDSELLSAWAERADEPAFCSLVARYGGFVYGAALRRAGDSALAEEITQDVFARLAQHARRLVSHPTIAGWLHRSAMLIALERIRRKARHARRIAHLAAMNQPTRDPWQDILPLLDEALDGLATRDREVVMLHFIERRTFPEIARTVGGTPDAARMRANRALVELARVLGKKCAGISAALLAAKLSTTASHAMPSSIAALVPSAISGTVKVSAGTIFLHAIHTMKVTKIAAVFALVLALAIPLTVQQQAIADSRLRVAALQHEQTQRLMVNGRPGSATQAQGASDGRLGINLKQLGQDAVTVGFLAKQRIRDAVASLDANNLAGLIETILHGEMLRAQREPLLGTLLTELRQRDPRLFLEWSMKTLAALEPGQRVGLGSKNFASGYRSDAAEAFLEWVAKNPAEATAWAAQHGDDWLAFNGGTGFGTKSLETLTVGGLLTSDPARAFAMLDAMSTGKCMDALFERGRLPPAEAKAFTEWAATIPDMGKRRQLLREAIARTRFDDPKDRTAFLPRVQALTGLKLNDADFAWLSARVIQHATNPLLKDPANPPVAEFAWVEKNIAPELQTYVKGTLGHLFLPNQALVFLGAQFDTSPQDDLIAGYVESGDMVRHPGMMGSENKRRGETAFKFATRTQEPERRLALLQKAWTDLHRDSAEMARTILEIPELKPEDRATLETRIAPLLKEKP